jgi:hypothetical protein
MENKKNPLKNNRISKLTAKTVKKARKKSWTFV